MGFGHRVYKNFDPRAKIIKEACHALLKKLGINDPLLELAMRLEEVALHDEYFVKRKLYPNVDYYSGIIMRALGIPTNMFTVMFAIGRLPGWIAHWREVRIGGTRPHRPAAPDLHRRDQARVRARWSSASSAMNILMVCSEFAPWAKTGGLADAVSRLERALSAARPRRSRAATAVLSPRRRAGTETRPAGKAGARSLPRGRARLGRHAGAAGARQSGGLEAAAARGRGSSCSTSASSRPGTSTLDDARDAGRFLRLADAAVALASAIDWRPDVLHCHDWHTALVPVLQRLAIPTARRRPCSRCTTSAIRAIFADDVPARPTASAGSEQVCRAGRARRRHAQFPARGPARGRRVTTVSPTYAERDPHAGVRHGARGRA